MMTDKEKILKYLDYKGVPKSKFHAEIGVSNNFLEEGSSLEVDKLKVIINSYQDLNMDWFFDDNAPMLITENNHKNTTFSEASNENMLLEMLRLKDIKIQESYEEIGKLKEIIRGLQVKNQAF